MRNLDLINPAIAKPAQLVSLGSIVPIAFSLIGVALSSAAAPSVSLIINPISILSLLVLFVAIGMIFLPRANHWGWNTIHFGASLFHLASITLICLVPCLCFLLYSSLPLLIRTSIFLVYVASHVIWCSRFFKFYEKINSDPDIASLLYQEEDDAIYYMQQVDKYLIEKKYKFRQCPKDRYFFVSALLAFLLLFFMNPMRTVIGLPFIHIFFLVSTFPISLMAAGLATRSWLTFYYYPKQMRRRTSKQTYVDMGSKSQCI